MVEQLKSLSEQENHIVDYIKTVLNDFRICCLSRECSVLGRKEVLTGKAKFGIFGGGKEVAQVAMAHSFKKGDFRSGYYRDQTLMLALDVTTIKQFFAQLYADAEPGNDPFSGGRQMNAHFATPMIDQNGNWLNHKDTVNVSSDISPTAGQMARAVGLAMASKVYRESESISKDNPFSDNGNEICFCTIGDASTTEGVFWESVNASGVTQIPLAISVWDDGYGISVPIKYQTTKSSISKVLSGFQTEGEEKGLELYTAKGWDYPALCTMFETGTTKMREEHHPALFHVTEIVQPQGHSTSGSHERYKSKERLEWEKEFDCIKVMKNWILETGLATAAELEAIESDAKKEVKQQAKEAWADFINPIKQEIQELLDIYGKLIQQSINKDKIVLERDRLLKAIDPLRKDLYKSARAVLRLVFKESTQAKKELEVWLRNKMEAGVQRYQSNLYSETPNSVLNIEEVKAEYDDETAIINGFQVLNACFDEAMTRVPELVAFGEDVGHIGDVNQGFAGLQEKYGQKRIFDTGIREWTIMGQGIGMAMRGIRPIAEIQYLDYLMYGLPALCDDLATIRYRSNGIQMAPMIVRTRGHRLEGIWHSGSPINMILSSLRGMCVLVPRNMTQAAGFYNTMLKSDDPAIIIECLNGYRLKEKMPSNIGEFTVPVGIPEVLSEGSDVTVVTYGSCVRVASEALKQLDAFGISAELIDVQSLLPFDINKSIVESLKKTNRIVFLDEDVPGGATSYMLQQVLEVQEGFQYLDSQPITITAAANRPPYGSEGDYFTKPSAEDVSEKIYALMHEVDPNRFPEMYFMD